MITGIVLLARREALVRLLVRGGEGRASEVEAVLDTGFTEELSLPQDLIDALLLPFVRTESTMLSDGSIIECNVHEGVVVWDGAERVVLVQAAKGSPLIGMSLLLDHLVTLPVTDSGQVTIEVLP